MGDCSTVWGPFNAKLRWPIHMWWIKTKHRRTKVLYVFHEYRNCMAKVSEYIYVE